MKAPVPESNQASSETLNSAEAPTPPRTTGALGLAFVLLLLLAGFALSAWQMLLLQDEQKPSSTTDRIDGLAGGNGSVAASFE